MTENTMKLTPMMQQYMAQKERYKDTLLFFRMGDFFEMFFEDAVVAAKVLDIALTKRGTKEGQEAIPMCGVPAHSYEQYLQKLIRAGYKVGICDQMESPEEAKKRGYKEIVRREVVRVVTAGTLTEENLLDASRANNLLCFAKAGKEYALAWVDISTGSFETCQISRETIAAEFARLAPSEILLSDEQLYDENMFDIYADFKNQLTPQSANIFQFKRAENKLKNFYKVISLEGFGALSAAEICACGALLEYVELTQKEALPCLEFPRRQQQHSYMQIDAATRKSLELTQSTEQGGKTLLSTVIFCKTSAGSRLLFNWLSSPLIYAEGVNARADCVEYLFNNSDLQAKLQSKLEHCPDFERAISRIAIGRGTPRDMLSLRQSLTMAMEVKTLLNKADLPDLLKQNAQTINPQMDLLNKLVDAFRDEVGVHLQDGNFIREGYNSNLDQLVSMRDHSRKLITELKEKYAAQTGISNLKINHNNVIGFYVEITAQNASKLDSSFIHRQTMSNAMRFSTQELSELESKIISARDQALQLELRIFAEVAEEITAKTESLLATARALAFVDVTAGLAELAQKRKYTRPKVDDSNNFNIQKGRHAVVEAGIDFIANDCNLNITQNLWLLTGPNMAGKSTFLRQNALIAILAQIGSFVPAEAAHIGCVDRIFSRVGASDNLNKGQSTFMVEMLETALILNHATEKSLVILDEIGRGTATYDGLSIAWAVLEYLHNKTRARAIFATHYHELTKLRLERLALYSMQVKEWDGKIVFLHEVAQGAANRSYGIHVAKLAGVPATVIKRAEAVLQQLTEQSKGEQSLPLFEAKAPVQIAESQSSEVEDAMHSINPDELSPKEALEKLYELRKLL